MYKLLIVDDEDIEREGMAQLIPWSDYNVELVGTAWNGVDGFEKVQSLLPDIVLTDIKMPVMNGIELIRRIHESFQEIVCVVLSGYGEYEFTSQAMAEGVRHYILKPCDEEKIIAVLDKAKAELDALKAQHSQMENFHKTVSRLLPRAKEQVFRNLLLDREQLKNDYDLFMDEIGEENKRVKILSMKSGESFDNLEQFVLGNILGELLGQRTVLLSTVIETAVYFLIANIPLDTIEAAVERTRQEFKRVRSSEVYAAVSPEGELNELHELFLQIRDLYRIGNTQPQELLLHYDLFKVQKSQASLLTDFERLQKATDYAEILFEVYLSFVKMELEQYTFEQKKEAAGWILRILYGEMLPQPASIPENDIEQLWTLITSVVDTIASHEHVGLSGNKEEQRVKSILLAVFRYIRNPEMSIQYLAKEVLFMNEDYFSRIFVKNRKVKFSTFLLEQRIFLALRLLQYNPDIKVSSLAQMTGYSPDGQYFSKAFRKVTGKSPSEYREQLKMK